MKRKTTADDVRQVLLSAVADALDDGKQQAQKKPGLTGVRAVATGAVLYTAGRAVVSGRRFYRERFGADANGAEEEYDEQDEDPEALADPEPEEEEYDEPEAEEEEEPEAEVDDEDYDESEEEPEAEEDEGPEADADEDDEPRGSADRPPVHEDEPSDPDLPPRPSRRRKPVRT